MVDADSHDGAPEPGIAPVNRDKRVDPGVIEGEITARDEDEAQGGPHASESIGAAASPPSPPRARRSAGGVMAFLAGAVGGAVVAALIAAGNYYVKPASDLAQENARRLTALETNSQRDNSAQEAEARREAAALSDLAKRLGALEAANSANPAAAATEATERLSAEMKDLRAGADAGREETAGLADRIAKLETGASRTSGDGPGLAALEARIEKIEAAQAAAKSETQVAAQRSAAGDNAAAIAIVAAEVRDKLASGAPLGPELAALERLGVEPEELTALEAVVNGAPTGKALAASFAAAAPKVLDATSHPVRGGAVDRLLAHIRGLVHVHVLNERSGDDPSALISQIEGALGRGDAVGALIAFNQLPEGARQAAGDWAAQAGARRAADAEAQSIADSAIGRLARDAKP